MKFTLLLALAVLAASIPHFHCYTPHGIRDEEYATPSAPEGSYDDPREVKGYLKNKPNAVTFLASYSLKGLQDGETSPYIIQTLKELRDIFKEKFAVIIEKIKAKVAELNTTFGERAEQVKAQLKELRDQLGASREQLRDKIREIFSPSQYLVEDLLQRNLRPFGARLLKFLNEVKDTTVEKLDHLKQMIGEIREEINQKLVELMRTTPTSHSLKKLHYNETSPDIIQTLNEVQGILEEKLAVTAEKIKAKVAELNTTSGGQAEQVKLQLKGLRDQLSAIREQLRDKIREIFSPSQYFVRNLLQWYLRPLQEQLLKFLDEVTDATGEKLESLKQMIRKIREEIRQKLAELMGTIPSSYCQLALQDDETLPYIIQALKELEGIFKKKFAVIVQKIEAKVAELNTTSVERAEQVKVQLKELREQLAANRYQLRDKIRAIFSSCPYAIRDIIQKGNGNVVIINCN